LAQPSNKTNFFSTASEKNAKKFTQQVPTEKRRSKKRKRSKKLNRYVVYTQRRENLDIVMQLPVAI